MPKKLIELEREAAKKEALKLAKEAARKAAVKKKGKDKEKPTPPKGNDKDIKVLNETSTLNMTSSDLDGKNIFNKTMQRMMNKLLININ